MVNQIKVDEETSQWARVLLERTLAIVESGGPRARRYDAVAFVRRTTARAMAPGSERRSARVVRTGVDDGQLVTASVAARRFQPRVLADPGPVDEDERVLGVPGLDVVEQPQTSGRTASTGT